jgi:hypothetical protein
VAHLVFSVSFLLILRSAVVSSAQWRRGAAVAHSVVRRQLLHEASTREANFWVDNFCTLCVEAGGRICCA